jgi:hypothetical protein
MPGLDVTLQSRTRKENRMVLVWEARPPGGSRDPCVHVPMKNASRRATRRGTCARLKGEGSH